MFIAASCVIVKNCILIVVIVTQTHYIYMIKLYGTPAKSIPLPKVVHVKFAEIQVSYVAK